MVKVKVEKLINVVNRNNSFNHPMVKVKVLCWIYACMTDEVSTTLWWKLKILDKMATDANTKFQPPYGES